MSVAGVSARDLVAGFKDFESLLNQDSSMNRTIVDESAHDKAVDGVDTEEEKEDSGDEIPLLIEQNFQDRGLSPPHFMCADAATLPDTAMPLLRDAAAAAATTGIDDKEAEIGRFDAIVTDPPYGKREWLGETKQEQVKRQLQIHFLPSRNIFYNMHLYDNQV